MYPAISSTKKLVYFTEISFVSKLICVLKMTNHDGFIYNSQVTFKLLYCPLAGSKSFVSLTGG